MSVLNQSGEEQECPLCLEALELDDLNFYPCTCGYQICRFCWNRIRETENGLCPACRKAYPENPADFTPLSREQVVKIKTEKKAREQRRRNKTLESRRQLANVRVVQNNLVFVVGLPVRLADPEILKRQEYFGKYGKIHKVVINQSTTYAGSQGPSASAYVTYVSSADALRAIQSVNNVTIDGRVLKGSLGTTKYCANFMKNQPCPKTDCMYLHELGDPNASFSKEEMHLGMHQAYERKLHEMSLAQQQQQALTAASGTSTNGEKSSSKEKNQQGFISSPMVTSSNINIVNSNNSKSNKKEEPPTSGSPSDGKEAWPSLGSSPQETDSSDNSKRPSPKPQENGNGLDNTSLSQEDESSETSSTTQSQRLKDISQSRDKSKTEAQWSKNGDPDSSQDQTFETANNYELDEIESDRHSLLENHDLLDNEHGLLDDDSHSLLSDNSSDAVMMQRHREMLASLVDGSHMMHKQIVDSFGLLDGYDRPVSHGVLDKELREDRSDPHKHFLPLNAVDSAQLLGTNYHNPAMLTPFGVRPDGTVPNFAPTTSGLGLPTGGLANAGLPTGLSNTGLPTGLGGVGLGNSGLSNAALGNAGLAGTSTGYAEPQEGRYFADNMDKFFTDFHKTQQLKMLLGKVPSGGAFGSPRPHNMMHAHSLETQHKQRHQELLAAQNAASLGAPLNPGMNSINMPMNSGMNGMNSALGITNINSMGNTLAMPNMSYTMGAPMNSMAGMTSLRPGMNSMGPGMSNMVGGMNMGGGMSNMGAMGMNSFGMGTNSSAGKRPIAVDDDLDFDPFKETQKAFAEMMENELQQNGMSPSESAERMRRSRLPPPGFSPMNNAFTLQQQQQQQVDWTQMDPAIMSTSVKLAPSPDMLQRLSQLGLQGAQHKPNGLHGKLNWRAGFPQEQSYIPLPPGFSDLAQSASEIESK